MVYAGGCQFRHNNDKGNNVNNVAANIVDTLNDTYDAPVMSDKEAREYHAYRRCERAATAYGHQMAADPHLWEARATLEDNDRFGWEFPVSGDALAMAAA